MGRERFAKRKVPGLASAPTANFGTKNQPPGPHAAGVDRTAAVLQDTQRSHTQAADGDDFSKLSGGPPRNRWTRSACGQRKRGANDCSVRTGGKQVVSFAHAS